MTDVLAYAIAQVEPPLVGVHLLWSGPWQWVWSLDGWSIQRRDFRRPKRDRRCATLGDAELTDLRRTYRRATSLGVVTLRRGTWGEEPCEVYTFELASPTPAIFVRATAGRILAIARRGSQAVGHVFGAGVVPGEVRAAGITGVTVYTLKASALEVCVEVVDDEAEDHEWEGVPFVVEHLQLPLTELTPSLAGPAGELAEAKARLLAGEVLDERDFEHVTGMLRASVRGVHPPRPADQVALLRPEPGTEADESMAVDPLRILATHPMWRRVLGFGWFDDDPALVPGQVYEYRVTGTFPADDLDDRVYGFHTTPAGTPLPAVFWIGDLRVRLPQPVAVALEPRASPTGDTTEVTRRGVPIRGLGEPWWQVPDLDGNSVVLDLPVPVRSVILEMAPGPAVTWATATDGGTVAAGPQARIDTAIPFDQLRVTGDGFLFAVRVPDPAGSGGTAVCRAHVGPVALVDTPRPVAPLTASIANLQEATAAIDPSALPPPRHDLGFDVRWQPALSGPPAPWPSDAPPAPLDATVYELGHRAVTGGTPGPWERVLVDDTGAGHDTIGDRGSPTTSRSVTPGGDLLEAFPEPADQPATPGTEVHWPDVFDFGPAGSIVRPVPAPGTFHQYRVRTKDAIGRVSLDWRETNVLRLEKHVPPPLPAAPPAAPGADDGKPRPTGVFARALVRDAPDLTADDVALLGGDDDAVVLSWGWRDEERTQDPLAREFRVYLADHPLDRLTATVTTVAPFGTGRHVLTLYVSAALAPDELVGTWLHAGHPFRAIANTAGTPGSPGAVTVEANVPLPGGALPVPSTGPIDLALRLGPARFRPPAWTERVGTVAISADTTYRWVFRNVLQLGPTRPANAIWVGVSAADDQDYVADQLSPVDTRPGNESGIAAVSVSATYHGRPIFDVPPPLDPVPVVVTPEVNGRGLRCRLDLTGFLSGTGLAAGAPVRPERASAAGVFAAYRVTDDDRVIALPVAARQGDVEAEVVIPNPGDRAAVATALRNGRTGDLEGRFVVFLAGSHPFRDRLFTAAGEASPLGPFEDVFPAEPGRWVYRFRSADAAGHLSAGAAMAGCVVRVPSTMAPGAPDRLPAVPGDPPGRIRLHVGPDTDLAAVVTFVQDIPTPAPPGPLGAAAIVRIPNRTDLAAGDALFLRTDAGELVPATPWPLPPPGADGSRTLAVEEAGADDRSRRLWAATVSLDGVPSRLAGPWTLRWPPPEGPS